MWSITVKPKGLTFLCNADVPEYSYNILQKTHWESERSLHRNRLNKEEISTHNTAIQYPIVHYLKVPWRSTQAHLLRSLKIFLALPTPLICTLCKYPVLRRFWTMKHTEPHLDAMFFKVCHQNPVLRRNQGFHLLIEMERCSNCLLKVGRTKLFSFEIAPLVYPLIT